MLEYTFEDKPCIAELEIELVCILAKGSSVLTYVFHPKELITSIVPYRSSILEHLDQRCDFGFRFDIFLVLMRRGIDAWACSSLLNGNVLVNVCPQRLFPAQAKRFPIAFLPSKLADVMFVKNEIY